jgi:acid phosphatase family membrane protein YuiD
MTTMTKTEWTLLKLSSIMKTRMRDMERENVFVDANATLGAMPSSRSAPAS